MPGRFIADNDSQKLGYGLTQLGITQNEESDKKSIRILTSNAIIQSSEGEKKKRKSYFSIHTKNLSEFNTNKISLVVNNSA